MQGDGILPVLPRAQDERHGRAAGRPSAPVLAVSTVGPVAALPPAPLVGEGGHPPRKGADDLHEDGAQLAAAAGQAPGLARRTGRGGLLYSALRLPPAFPRRSPRRASRPRPCAACSRSCSTASTSAARPRRRCASRRRPSARGGGFPSRTGSGTDFPKAPLERICGVGRRAAGPRCASKASWGSPRGCDEPGSFRLPRGSGGRSNPGLDASTERARAALVFLNRPASREPGAGGSRTPPPACTARPRDASGRSLDRASGSSPPGSPPGRTEATGSPQVRLAGRS